MTTLATERLYPITDLPHARLSLVLLERDWRAGWLERGRYVQTKARILLAIARFEARRGVRA